MEIVMLDDGFGAKLERRAAVSDDRHSFGRHLDAPSPALVCYHCGAAALLIYRRSFRGPVSHGQDGTASAVALESWTEKPYCSVGCAERAIRSGGFWVDGAGPAAGAEPA